MDFVTKLLCVKVNGNVIIIIGTLRLIHEPSLVFIFKVGFDRWSMKSTIEINLTKMGLGRSRLIQATIVWITKDSKRPAASQTVDRETS